MKRIKNIEKINEKELELGITDGGSWHVEFSKSPYIYIGGLDFQVTEGDIVTVFSQY